MHCPNRHEPNSYHLFFEWFCLFFEITVSAHIERHSWLERHGAQFGHTMVIFSYFLSKIKVFLDKIWPKMTIVHSLKILNFNRTPAFYMRGYGSQIGEFHVQNWERWGNWLILFCNGCEFETWNQNTLRTLYCVTEKAIKDY